MIWIQFVISSLVIVLASKKLSEYGETIAIRTGLGSMFIGMILLAGATSLPEFLTTISAINLGVPDIAAGNMFGSNMFNMFILGCIGVLFYNTRLLRRVAHRHALTGSLAVLLNALAIFFILLNPDIKILWVGIDSILIIAVYLIGVWLVRSETNTSSSDSDTEIDPKTPSLLRGIAGFVIATLVLIFAVPWLVSSSNEIASVTGLGTGFVGVLLVAFVTSLPEVVTTIVATRMGLFDMAVGNLLGSNLFNMFSLGLADFFMLNGRFIGSIDPRYVLVGTMAIILTCMALIGNVARLERKILFLEIDAILLIICYVIGIFIVYNLGIGL